MPVGSQLVVRATGNVSFDMTPKGGLDDAQGRSAQEPLPTGHEERRFIIKGDGAAVLHGVGSNDLTWTFTAIPDRAPTIALIKDPERQLRGSLRLDYKMEDDYGVVDARRPSRSRTTKDAGSAPHPLFTAPEFQLTLPQARTRSGTAQTIHDLTEHPWAGAKVTMTLVARDEAGNEGRSEPREFTLPERVFVKPVARALIEQRRILALDANEKPLVLTALDALTIAPEKFTPETARLSRPALDLFRPRTRQDRRRAARGGGAHVGHGGADRGRQHIGRRTGVAPGAGRAAPGARTRRQRRRAEEADG